MADINFIFEPLLNVMLGCDGCCCKIEIPEGFVGGECLTVVIDPTKPVK